MAVKFGEVVEGVGGAECAGVNQTHEEVAHLGPVLGLEKTSALCPCGNCEKPPRGVKSPGSEAK